MTMLIKPPDIARLKREFASARPFPFIKIDRFLDDAFAEEVAAAYPSFSRASQLGYEFKAVNERRKIQIPDRSAFPEPVKRLEQALASAEFLSALAEITQIPKLLADEKLDGGGIHETGAQGRLDVHVDFNYLRDRALHRRLNLLLYLNPGWQDSWGGLLELWDKDVKICCHSFPPISNRCVIFETSEISYHGVSAVTCPDDVVRKSFAAYYYTREPAPSWTGKYHSTKFRARPTERVKGWVWMPAEKVARAFLRAGNRLKKEVRRLTARRS
jgi:2OG-Fe(II) oxygenase superfamily